jgi:septum formation protein
MFILASASLSRKKLLKGHRFRVVPSGVREVRRKTLRATCVTNARLKADAVARRFPTDWVLAADTMIAYGGRIYGKPRDRKAAVRLLRSLAGQTHTLGTGVVLQKGRFRIVKFVTSKVTLHDEPPVERIVARTDPTQYAGGYAIREKNDPLIRRIDGSRSNVIGLPMEFIEPLLRKLEREVPAPAKPARKAPLRGYILV